jgi:hypothetical protein
MKRLGVSLAALSMVAMLLPAAASAQSGGFFHGGKPTSPINITCALTGSDPGDYDVVATIDPDVVVQMFAQDWSVVVWAKTSAKVSAPAVFIGTLGILDVPTNLFGEFDMLGPGYPLFTYVLVQATYFDYNLGHEVVLASATARCRNGDLVD